MSAAAPEPAPPAEAPGPAELAGRGARLRAWLDMFFRDHGFFRYAYLNLHDVDGAGRLWRSAQPGPGHLRRLRERLGLRTVVNLRGPGAGGAYLLERDACRRLGLRLVDFRMTSRAAPSRAVVAAADQLFGEIDYPALLHCKSGADRAGIAAALYLLLREGRPVAEAAGQLALRFGHVRQAKTGMLDFFLQRYAEDGAARGLGFREWVAGPYDKAAVEAAFHEQWMAGVLVDRILRRE